MHNQLADSIAAAIRPVIVVQHALRLEQCLLLAQLIRLVGDMTPPPVKDGDYGPDQQEAMVPVELAHDVAGLEVVNLVRHVLTFAL